MSTTNIVKCLPLILTACLSYGIRVQAEEIIIRGNSNGLWSVTHPHATGLPANPPGVDHSVSDIFTAPPFNPPVEEEPEVAIEPDVCPTLLSAPHLCQNI